MNNKELIKVIEAAERGEKIEFRIGGMGCWEQKTNTSNWNTYNSEYRIARPEPVLVPHWPAIWRTRNNGYAVSGILFACENDARDVFEDFVRLATEYPPIMRELSDKINVPEELL